MEQNCNSTFKHNSILKNRVKLIRAMYYSLLFIEDEESSKNLEQAIYEIRKDKYDHFLAISLNDSNTVSFSKHYKNKKNESKRIKTTLGRYLIRNFSIDISDYDLHCFTNAVLIKVCSEQELESQITILSNDEIMNFYATNDDPKDDNGLHSCMTGACSKYTELYSLNPDKVSLVTFGNRARALLWTTDDGTKVLDRYYPSNSKYGEYLRQWAKNKGYVLRKNPDRLVESGNIELSDDKQHIVTLKCNDVFPYLDTFKFGELFSDNYLITSNYESFGNIFLTNTEGLFRHSFCESCNKSVSGANRIIKDGYVYCISCFNEIHCNCSGCGKIYRKSGAYHAKEKLFCYDCFHNSYFLCYFCNETFEIDDGLMKINSGYNCCKECTSTKCIIKCQKCQRNYTKNYLSEVFDKNNNITYYCNYDIQAFPFCVRCEKYFSYTLINNICKHCNPDLYSELDNPEVIVIDYSNGIESYNVMPCIIGEFMI